MGDKYPSRKKKYRFRIYSNNLFYYNLFNITLYRGVK